MPRIFNKTFTEDYKNQVFSTWYTHGMCKIGKLVDFLQPDEEGDIPETSTINRWRVDEAWDTRAETLNIEVQTRADRKLVSIRLEMMQRIAEKAREVQEMAFDYLKESGFDSSASAVAALFKAFDTERQSRGMEVALAQVGSMDDQELQKTMNRLLNRVRGLGDGDEDVTIVPEEIDAAGNDETTDE